MLKKTLLFCLLLPYHLAFAVAVLSVIPSITSTTLRSDSETSILYTVTNNTNQTLTNLTIAPGYRSNAVNLSDINNTCTTNLAAGASCTFKEFIPGSNQPNTFYIRPRVCAYNNAVCAQPPPADNVTVTDIAIDTPVRAYVNLKDQNRVAGVNPADSDVTLTSPGFNFNDSLTGAAVSNNGETLYISNNGSNPATMFISDVSGPLVKLTSSVQLENAASNPTGLALSPDNQFAYIAGQAVDKLYKVNLSTNAVTEIALGVAAEDPSGVVVSPDGNRVYVTNGNNTISVINPITNSVITTITDVDGTEGTVNDIPCAVISPDGTKLYATIVKDPDVGLDSAGLAIINTSTNTVSARVLDDLLQGDQSPRGITISHDGNTLYIAETDQNRVVAVDLTDNNAVSTLTTTGLNQPYGIAITPDGTTLLVSNFGSNNVTKIVLSPLAVSTIQLIPALGGQTVFGNFVG